MGRKHPGEVKITHWFPAFFLLGLLTIPVLFLFSPLGAQMVTLAYAIYSISVAVDCFIKGRSVQVALLSMPSVFVQMTGYGYGFLKTLLS